MTAETAKSSSQGSSSPELERVGFSVQSSIFCPSQQAGMESHVGTAEHPDAGEGRRGEGRVRKGRGGRGREKKGGEGKEREREEYKQDMCKKTKSLSIYVPLSLVAGGLTFPPAQLTGANRCPSLPLPSPPLSPAAGSLWLG